MKAIKVLKEKGYEIVNTLFTDEWYSADAMKERGVEDRIERNVLGKNEK